MFSFCLSREYTNCRGALRPGNDTVNKKRRVRRDTWAPPYNRAFFVGQGPRALPGVRYKPARADRGVRPYG